MPEYERQLLVAALTRRLPCSKECTFGLQCASKFVDGTCRERIDQYVKQDVYGTPGEKIIKTVNDKPEIHFDTANPQGKVVIKEGYALIHRGTIQVDI